MRQLYVAVSALIAFAACGGNPKQVSKLRASRFRERGRNAKS